MTAFHPKWASVGCTVLIVRSPAVQGLSRIRSFSGFEYSVRKLWTRDAKTDRMNAGRQGGRGRGVMALVGYARVPAQEQELALQPDTLRAAGCDPVFKDYASGSRANRLSLTQ